MKNGIVKVVNKGLEGEPQHICFQDKNTLEIIEFSKVKCVEENEITKNVELIDSDFNQLEILHILNVLRHECVYTMNENGEVTLHF